MKTLVIDTSLAVGTVAALDGDRISQRSLPTAGEHARLLATALVDVAAALGWRCGDAELVAVVRGPGSFTGLRVGVTTAKALCWTVGSRLLGVSAAEAIAAGTAAAVGRHDAPVAVPFDAGRGDLFVSVVVPDPRSPSGWTVASGGLVTARDWLAGLAADTLVGGPGLAVLAAAFAARPDLVVAPPEAWLPAAAEIGRIARLRAAAGEADDPATLVPDYIRPSYAEEPARP